MQFGQLHPHGGGRDRYTSKAGRDIGSVASRRYPLCYRGLAVPPHAASGSSLTERNVMTEDLVEVREAGEKGRGVFARRDFHAGDCILRFQGRVVHHEALQTLTPWEREHLSELTAETYQILPSPRCYLNHACLPNAYSTDSAVYAWREIVAGEEITVDYRLNAHDDGDVYEMICRCAAYPEPHRVIGDFFSLPDERQAAYLPYAPAFIQEEYHRRRGRSSLTS